MKTYCIYTLTDPETSLVRYIGCTVNPHTRFKQHLSERVGSLKYLWIEGLRAKGLVPIFTIVANADNPESAAKEEQRVYAEHDANLLIAGNPNSYYYKNDQGRKALPDNRRKKQRAVYATDPEWSKINNNAEIAGKEVGRFIVEKALQP